MEVSNNPGWGAERTWVWLADEVQEEADVVVERDDEAVPLHRLVDHLVYESLDDPSCSHWESSSAFWGTFGHLESPVAGSKEVWREPFST